MHLDHRFQTAQKVPSKTLGYLFVLLSLLLCAPLAMAEERHPPTTALFETELSGPQDGALLLDHTHTLLTIRLPGKYTSYTYTVWNRNQRIEGAEQPLADPEVLTLDLHPGLRQEARFSKQRLKVLLTLRGEGEPLELSRELIYHFIARSPIPIIEIDAPAPVSRERIPANFAFYDEPGPDGWYFLGGPHQSADGTIHARGQSSLGFPKKSFALNFGKENPLSIMGMPASHKWVMIGGYVDTTHIANKVSYDLYAEMGHYGPQSRFVQVFFKEKYWGLYTFGEKIQRGKNHVDTPKKSKGGFIVKEVDSNPAFRSLSGRTFDYEYPDSEDVTPEMAEHIQGTIDNYERKVMEGEDWRENLNEEAEIDYFLVTDVFANPDSYFKDKNLFYFLNRDGKLEPVIWDFIWAFGAPYFRSQGNDPWPCIYGSTKCDFCQPSTCPSAQPEQGDNQLMYGNLARCNASSCLYNAFPLMKYYLADAQNVEMYRERYLDWRKGRNGHEPLLSDESLSIRIDALLAPLKEGDVYALDYERWQYSTSRPRYCAPGVDLPYCCTPRSAACHVSMDIKQKLLDRLRIMDLEVPEVKVRSLD